MDFPTVESAIGSLEPSTRLRKTSFSSTGSVRRKLPVRLRSQHSSMSLASQATSISDASAILSPTPRRHALLQSDHIEWLRTPPVSPRPSSPLNPNGSHARTLSRQGVSFSSLMEEKYKRRYTRLDKKEDGHSSPGRRWLKWMSRNGMKDWIVPCSISCSACFKWCIGLGAYSGYQTPPMYGDYEAQRHWMEITIHLPVSEWYRYDLQYWGLDYPPLTAYHSWLCGKIGSWINPSWFALDLSRGFETPESKVFMRSTVLFSDLLVYVPALVMLVNIWNVGRSSRMQNSALLYLLFHPSLLLIDFGHFQYNSVMLGFTLHALNAFATGHDFLGCIFFVLSLGFKQMALYYAPVIGAFLLGKCLWLRPDHGARLFSFVAVVTVASFVVLFLPLLKPSSMIQTITRIFPFNRGLFEDKVANFWCASDVVFKWRNIQFLGRAGLVRLSGLLTIIGFTPSVYGLLMGAWTRRQSLSKMSSPTMSSKPGTLDYSKTELRCPTTPLLPYALFTTSMTFFLFSFQVHEKSILLPLMPLTLLMSSATPGSVTWEWGLLVNNVAVFSMFPLLNRDGLTLQYIVVTCWWNWLIGFDPRTVLKPVSFIQLLSLATYSSIGVLHILQLLIAPPSRFPDLYPVLNVLISSSIFFLSWLWSIKRGIEVGWALGGLSPAIVISKTRTAKSNGHKKEQ